MSLFSAKMLVLERNSTGKVVMFNKSQIQAIGHNEGPAIVLAGPGSGKTTVITHRIKKLIEDYSVLPKDILVATFTKAAAVNMKERFLALINEGKTTPVSYGVTFGTFHSIFYRILRITNNYKEENIVSNRQKNDYIKEIAIRMRLEVLSIPEFISNAASEISKIKSNMLSVEQFNSSCCKKEKFREFFREYQKTLSVEGKIDFDDMLLKCYELLKERNDILKIWQNRFRYILIDEFQDINKIQYNIVKLLALPENNIFIVGDDDQSIYGFRGASPHNMFQFKKDYPVAKEIILGINYRSTKSIVNLSHNIIKNNKVRFEKEIVSAKAEGKMPEIRCFRNQSEELKVLSRKIKEYKDNGVRTEEIAILVRNNSQIPQIIEFLQNEMVHIFSQTNKGGIYESMVAKDVLAYIRAARNVERLPLNENSDLIYILNKPSRFISRQVLAGDNMDFKRLKKVYEHSSEVLRNIDDLQFHLSMIATLNPQAALTYIRYGAEYEKYLKQYAAEKRIRFSGLLKQFSNLQSDASMFKTMEEWLEFIENQLEKNIYLNDGEKKGVNIMTMHGAKGLEYRVIFIVDANQGIIPTSKAMRDKDYEEERRVFYVAVTRAIEELNIYYIKESLGCQMEMSMFINECY